MPLHDVNVIGARVVGRTLYGVTTGTPAKVSAVDARTGQALFTVPLPGWPVPGRRNWWVWTRTLAAVDLGLAGYDLFTGLPDDDLVLGQAQQLYRWDATSCPLSQSGTS